MINRGPSAKQQALRRVLNAHSEEVVEVAVKTAATLSHLPPQALELVLADMANDALSAKVKRHLKGCPDCREEFKVLKAYQDEFKTEVFEATVRGIVERAVPVLQKKTRQRDDFSSTEDTT